MSREVMQMALDMLNEIADDVYCDQKLEGVITALRQALETEPFEYWNAVEGWVKIDEVREHFDAVGCGTIYKSAGEGRSPLYTAPPHTVVCHKDHDRGYEDFQGKCLLCVVDELMLEMGNLMIQKQRAEKRNAALAQQEPVAWLSTDCIGERYLCFTKPKDNDPVQPLYTTPPKREWVGLTDEEIDALSQARSLTDELMDCVDRLGSEADTVDPRVWQHLLVYAPKPEEEPVAWMHTTGTGHVYFRKKPQDKVFNPQPVFIAPSKKPWVGLTDEEIQDLSYLSQKIDESNAAWFDRCGFARAIEAKLKERNE